MRVKCCGHATSEGHSRVCATRRWRRRLLVLQTTRTYAKCSEKLVPDSQGDRSIPKRNREGELVIGAYERSSRKRRAVLRHVTPLLCHLHLEVLALQNVAHHFD